jgi:hypothetical protein
MPEEGPVDLDNLIRAITMTRQAHGLTKRTREAKMRVASRPGDRVSRQVMPVVNSILWKPLRDPHYVLTSIQPDEGGFRQIFVQQSVILGIRRLGHRPSGGRLLGLLLGSRWDCPITGARYLVIESLEETPEATQDSKAMTAALVDRMGHHRGHESIECVGWYGSSEDAEPHVSSAQAAIHASLFGEPWPTALIVAEGGNSGAFFLHDTRGPRWFQAPFYELGHADRKAHAAKSTCLAWPAYLTTETVVPLLSPSQPEEAAPRPRVMATPRPTRSRRSALATIGALWKPARRVVSGLGRAVAAAFRWVRKSSSYVVQTIASGGAAAGRIGTALRSSVTQRTAERARKAAELAERARVTEAERKERARAAHAARLEQARIAAAARAERERLAAERTARERAERERTARERAERERAERERLATERAQQERLAAERAEQARRAAQETERARRSEPIAAAPITNNDIPLRKAPQPARPAAVEPARPTTPRKQKAHSFADDGEDTTASDLPYRYLALARREGFQVSTNLERAGADGTETVWLLNEPESGIQITLVTSDVAVVEANLHYNIRIKDDVVFRATRPEHRDLDSRTIYVRESCVESLRARCRRLRATGALQRDWKVTPSIFPPDSAAQ